MAASVRVTMEMNSATRRVLPYWLMNCASGARSSPKRVAMRARMVMTKAAVAGTMARKRRLAGEPGLRMTGGLRGDWACIRLVLVR